MAKAYGFLNRLCDLVFPPHCASCGETLDFTRLHSGSALCDVCAPKWEREKEEPCGHCMERICECGCMTAFLTEAKCSGFYKLVYYRRKHEARVQSAVIYRIKDVRERRTSQFLARELATVIQKRVANGELSLENAALSYVPRRRSTYLKSGNDQAKELSEALSETLGIPVLPAIARRRGRQKEQKTLTTAQRKANAKQSFAVREGIDVKGKTILLVDDIITTGSSMAAATKLLRRAGVGAVYCVAVASDESNRMPASVPLKTR